MPGPSNDLAKAATGGPNERLVLAGAWASMLAPVLAHGVWRGLIHASGGTGDAVWISAAAIVIALVGVLATWRWPGRLGRVHTSMSAAVLLAVFVIFGLDGSAAGMLASAGALLVVAVGVGVGLPQVVRRIPATLDGQARRRPRATLAVAALLALAVLQSGRLSAFMGDADLVELAVTDAVIPTLDHHSCMTAYVQAASLADARVDNLYDADWWPAVSGSPTSEAQALAYAPFGLDTYAYPPPFLLAPRVLLLVSDDFAVQRSVWYALNGIWLAFGLWFVATWIAESDPERGVRALLLWPLVWLSFPVLITVQVGNVHLAVVVAAVVAMIAFHRDQPAIGGAILAFAILAKISPGLLGIYLLVQRRWRDALWTAGFGLGWTILALAVFGPTPFEAFVHYELPRLQSGAALEFFSESAREIALNLAPFGIPFKLQALGVGFTDVWATGASIAMVFTLVVLGLSIRAGMRRGDRRTEVVLWLAVLTLGGLRSPFAPAYTAFGAIWLLSLWTAKVEDLRGGILLVIAFVILTGLPLTGDAAQYFSLVQVATLLGILGVAILLPARA